MKNTLALQKINNAFKDYEKYLINRDFLFFTDDNRYLEVSFLKRNFLHLTGVDTKLSAVDFYEKLKKRKLTIKDFNLKKDGTTQLKLSVIDKLRYIPSSSCIVGDYNGSRVYLKTDKIVGDSKGIVTVGFTKQDKGTLLKPNTLLKENAKHVTSTNSYTILTLSKEFGVKKYNKICYQSKHFLIKTIDKLNGSEKIDSTLFEIPKTL